MAMSIIVGGRMTQQGKAAWLAAASRLGVEVSARAAERLAHYRDRLLEWNQKFNLTAISTPREIERLLLLDSLTVLYGRRADGSPLLHAGDRLIDIGTGAGVPGLPLAIVRPDVYVLMIESVGKKARFVQMMIEELGLDNAEVRTARSEDLAHDPALRGSAAVVTARAVARSATLAELALPFAKLGGHAVLPKQEPIDDEIQAAGRAIQLLGGRLQPLVRVEDPELPAGRLLLVIEKVGETPAKYPRKAGLPAKAPL